MSKLAVVLLPADVQPVNLQDTLERLVREANEHGNGLVIVERIALATIAALISPAENEWSHFKFFAPRSDGRVIGNPAIISASST